MDSKIRKNLYFLIALVLVIAFSAVMADQVESNFGDVEVSVVEIMRREWEYSSCETVRS